MKKIVKCPLCGKMHQTRGKHYFKCCQIAWEVEKYQVTSYDEGRYTPPSAQAKKPNLEDLRSHIKEVIKQEVEKQSKTPNKEDELIELLRKDGQLRNYVKEFLRNRNIL